MVDETRRPLKIPPWHIPYLEKHRIYELFHEIARELVIQQPSDHVMFMKQILVNAARSRDVARVIILGAPRVDCMKIACLMAQITKQVIISETELLSMLETNSLQDVNAALLVKTLRYLTRTNNAFKLGWIMVDCIKNEEQAKEILKAGILPTHVIHLISPYYPGLNELVYCNVPSDFPQYRRQMSAIRHAFRNVLREAHLLEKPADEVVSDCVELTKIRPGIAPINPRIVLIGPRGSGRTSQARLLSQRLKVVHVQFERLLCQTWKSDSDLSKTMRECKDEVCLHPELMAQVVNKRILEEDCLNYGYVLTHYPFTARDFEYLDSLETPPNRVIFLEIDINICKERVRNMRQNVYTGSKVNLKKGNLENLEEYTTHPRNALDVFDAEAFYYCENYEPLRKYCSTTALAVNADQEERQVHESVLALVARAVTDPALRPGLQEEDLLGEELESVSSESFSIEDRCCCKQVPREIMACYFHQLKIDDTKVSENTKT